MHNISGGVPEDVFILFLLLPGGGHSKSYRIDSQIQFWRRFLRRVSLPGTTLFIYTMLICARLRLCFLRDLARDQSPNLPVSQQQGHCHTAGLICYEMQTKQGSLARLGGMASSKGLLALGQAFLLV